MNKNLHEKYTIRAGSQGCAGLGVSATACRRIDQAGTWQGSCNRNTIWGVRTSVNGFPSTSVKPGDMSVKGFRSGPTSSISSPAENLLRRDRVARPFSSQSVTIATT